MLPVKDDVRQLIAVFTAKHEMPICRSSDICIDQPYFPQNNDRTCTATFTSHYVLKNMMFKHGKRVSCSADLTAAFTLHFSLQMQHSRIHVHIDLLRCFFCVRNIATVVRIVWTFWEWINIHLQ